MKLVTKLVMVAVVPALVLSLLLSPIADNVSADYQPASGWTKYTGVLTMDGANKVADAWVINDNGTYRMWYTRLKMNEPYADTADRITALGGPAIVDAFINMELDNLLNLLGGLDAATAWDLLYSATTVIGYATSTNGINWTSVEKDLVFGDGGIHNGVGAPCVIKDGTTFKMWYSKFETDLNQAGLAAILGDLDDPNVNVQKAAIEGFLSQVRSVIGYAEFDAGMNPTSNNPQVFPATDGTVLASVGAPCVILDGTTYKMWYTGTKTDLTMARR